MNPAGSARGRLDDRALARQAIRAAASVRARAGLDQGRPICIYGLCDVLGVTVRFNDINMEGMYQRGPRPRIHLSALRPLPRRAYNCAHELGHHVFGHGSTIDALQAEARPRVWDDPKETLAEVFAGACLMPTIGIRRAFAVRGWIPETVTPPQMFTVACEFGVGYRTIITQLVGMGELSRAKASVLRRVSRGSIEADLLGAPPLAPVVVADLCRFPGVCDAEVGMSVVVPAACEIVGAALEHDRVVPSGRVFRAVRPGIVRATLSGTEWAVFVRIARVNYVGLAQYRHLEEEADE